MISVASYNSFITTNLQTSAPAASAPERRHLFVLLVELVQAGLVVLLLVLELRVLLKCRLEVVLLRQWLLGCRRC